jgi:hypothetical protein
MGVSQPFYGKFYSENVLTGFRLKVDMIVINWSK